MTMIKCEKFVPYLMQYSKMTRNLGAHLAQLLNPTFSKFCYSSYMVIITLYNSKILLSLHYFLTPEFQIFTNLLIGFFGVSNPTYFFEFGRNYVPIIVNIISNNSVLQCYLLWIFVSIEGSSNCQCALGSQPPTSKTSPLLFFFFAKPPYKSTNYPSPPFQPIHPPPPPK